MSIEANSWVLLKLSSLDHKIVQLVPGSVIQLQRQGSFLADELINRHFGYTYEVMPDKTLKLVDLQAVTVDADGGGVTEQTMQGDQIDYLGTNTLSMAEIEDLKKQGLKGEDIIAKITESHQDFEKKTEFSKAKYLKRKKQKYLSHVTPEPITSSVLLNVYMEKEASRVLNMGEESLALLLSLANIRPGGHYLVMDETPSVIVTAILERLGGRGSVTILHETEHANVDGLKYFEDWVPKDEGKVEDHMVKTTNLIDLLHPEESPKFVEKDVENMKSSAKPQYFRQLFREQQRQWIKRRGEEGFDGLVVATTLDLPGLINRLIPYVSGSAPIVVYSEYKERLVDLTLSLKHDLRVLAPTITETRVRKYQTLPGRMHPLMTSRAVGGYLLHGIRVYPSDHVQAMGHGINKKRKRKDTPGDSTKENTPETDSKRLEIETPEP